MQLAKLKWFLVDFQFLFNFTWSGPIFTDEGQTLKYDSETRNQCTSSNSGGIEILGYGVNNPVEKC